MQHSAPDVVRVIRGRWDWAPEIVRPYQCSTGKLSNTPNARMICSEEMKHRCANDTTSWRYTFRSDMDGSRPLLSGTELCDLVPRDERILFLGLGDSITHQLYMSACSRLLHDSSLNVSSSGQRRGSSTNSFQRGVTYVNRCACRTMEGAGASPQFEDIYTYFWDLCSEREGGHSCHIEFDGAIEACATSFRLNPATFTVFPIRQAHLISELRAAHPTMLVLNDFAHVHNVELALSQCYAKHLRHDAPEHNASELARDLARRDMVRYLTERAVRMATLLANAPLSSAPRVVYRTSSPAAERWLLGSAAVDTPAPLRLPAVDIGARGEAVEHGHDMYLAVNALSAAAFRSAGHTVVDVEDMLGVRIAAHHQDRQGDALHFCNPGPLDYVFDAMLRVLYGSSNASAAL